MTPARAKDLIRLTQWQNLGCGNTGNPRPDVEETTDEERNMLGVILSSMDGRYASIDVLHDIANGKCLITTICKALTDNLAKPFNGLG